jgi:hypothetical protein
MKKYRIPQLGLAVVLMLGACQTGTKYKVDEATVADLPLSERGELLMWQANRDRAQGEMQKADADAHTTEHAIVTAEAERGQAKLAMKKLESDLDLAKPRRDMARQGRLQAELDVAAIAKQAADTRVDWCKQQHEVYQAQAEAAKTNTQLSEARVEQARAHLAERHGRRPSGRYSVGNFDEQALRAERTNDKERQNVATQTSLSAAIGQQYAAQLGMYSQRRNQLQNFTSSYTPPGYISTP